MPISIEPFHPYLLSSGLTPGVTHILAFQANKTHIHNKRKYFIIKMWQYVHYQLSIPKVLHHQSARTDQRVVFS